MPTCPLTLEPKSSNEGAANVLHSPPTTAPFLALLSLPLGPASLLRSAKQVSPVCALRQRPLDPESQKANQPPARQRKKNRGYLAWKSMVRKNELGAL